MRTIRNVTFAVLCALALMSPANLLAASCDIDETWEGCYAGRCTDCQEAYEVALGTCGWPNGVPEMFYCDGEGGVSWCCAPIVMD